MLRSDRAAGSSCLLLKTPPAPPNSHNAAQQHGSLAPPSPEHLDQEVVARKRVRTKSKVSVSQETGGMNTA
jgi:hypothetical protein